MGIRNRLAEVYDRVPVLKCKGLCQDVCGPIPAARDEIRLMERAADRPYGWQVKTGHCTMFDEESGRCRCYRDRPLVCRAWGTVATSVCPFGCEPDRWLTHAEFEDLLVRVTDVAGPQSSPQPYLGDRRATEEEYRQSTHAAEDLLARGLCLPDLWNASRPYVICACCGWRGQSDEHVEPDEFAGEPCPQCNAGVLRMAQPGDRPLFVPKSRG